MPSRNAPGVRPAARDRVVHAGLSLDELELLRRVSRGRWEVAGDCSSESLSADGAHAPATVSVVSLDCLESSITNPANVMSCADWRGIVLLPAISAGERQQRLARLAPLAQLVLTGLPATPEALYSALVQSRHQSVAEALVSRLGDVHSPLVTVVLREALRLDPQQFTVDLLARAVHMHQRTLRRKLGKLGPRFAPQRVLGWARLLHVAGVVHHSDRTVDEIGELLCFSAAANLHRMLSAYAKVTLQELREHADPVGLLLARLREDLRSDGSLREA